MASTIQVSKQTLQILKATKEREHAESYDKLLRKHFEKEAGVPKSMFGSAPYLKKYLKPYKHEKWIHDE